MQNQMGDLQTIIFDKNKPHYSWQTLPQALFAQILIENFNIQTVQTNLLQNTDRSATFVVLLQHAHSILTMHHFF